MSSPSCRSRQPRARNTPAASTPSVQVWRVAPRNDSDPPPARFTFDAPVDNYAGEFARLTGELRLSGDLDLRGAGGAFEAHILDLTMGEKDLDANVRNNVELLCGKQFPVSTFTIRSIDGAGDRLRHNSANDVTLHGELTLKGVTIPLAVPAVLEPRTDTDGRRTIRLRASFAIEQLRARFNIYGPGGENEPAGDRVRVNVDTLLVRE